MRSKGAIGAEELMLVPEALRFEDPLALVREDIERALAALPRKERRELYPRLCRAGGEVIGRCMPEELLAQLLSLHRRSRELALALARVREEFVRERQEVCSNYLAASHRLSEESVGTLAEGGQLEGGD